MAGAPVPYGLLLITIAYNKVIVKSAESKKFHPTIPPQEVILEFSLLILDRESKD